MKDIKTNPEYYPYGCNCDGSIIQNLETGYTMKTYIGTHGYLCFVNSKDRKDLVHRMVASIWIGNDKNLPMVNHIDHNKTNNHFSNLEWCSYKHNTMEAVKAGVMSINCKYGEDCNLHIYKDELIHAVCRDLEKGMRNFEVSDKYGIPKSYIKDLKGQNSRRDITTLYNFSKYVSKSVQNEDVHEICRMISNGVKRSEIINHFNNPKININLIKNIRRKSCYKSISDLYF